MLASAARAMTRRCDALRPIAGGTSTEEEVPPREPLPTAMPAPAPAPGPRRGLWLAWRESLTRLLRWRRMRSNALSLRWLLLKELTRLELRLLLVLHTLLFLLWRCSKGPPSASESLSLLAEPGTREPLELLADCLTDEPEPPPPPWCPPPELLATPTPAPPTSPWWMSTMPLTTLLAVLPRWYDL